MEEIYGNPLWQYKDGYEHNMVAEIPVERETGGMKFVVDGLDERQYFDSKATNQKKSEGCFGS